MLSKCANPSCSSVFLYLHQGKLFRIDVSVPDKETGKIGRRAEFFWLCSDCARTMTLSYRHGTGIVATPIARAQAAAG